MSSDHRAADQSGTNQTIVSWNALLQLLPIIPTCFAVRKRLSAASIADLLGSRKLSELLTTEALVTEVSEKESRHRGTSNATGRHGLLNGNRNNN
jgi:hypothetical protein